MSCHQKSPGNKVSLSLRNFLSLGTIKKLGKRMSCFKKLDDPAVYTVRYTGRYVEIMFN